MLSSQCYHANALMHSCWYYHAYAITNMPSHLRYHAPTTDHAYSISGLLQPSQLRAISCQLQALSPKLEAPRECNNLAYDSSAFCSAMLLASDSGALPRNLSNSVMCAGLSSLSFFVSVARRFCQPRRKSRGKAAWARARAGI